MTELKAVSGGREGFSMHSIPIDSRPRPAQPQAAMGSRKETARPLRLGSLAGDVGYALKRAQAVVSADFSASLATLGLRASQFSALVLIDQNPGASQTRVSLALGVEKANFVATISALERRALVVRSRSANDARTYRQELIAQGVDLLSRPRALQVAQESRLTDSLGAGRHLQLVELLALLSTVA